MYYLTPMYLINNNMYNKIAGHCVLNYFLKSQTKIGILLPAKNKQKKKNIFKAQIIIKHRTVLLNQKFPYSRIILNLTCALVK